MDSKRSVSIMGDIAAISMGYSSLKEIESIKENGTVEEKRILRLRAKLQTSKFEMEKALTDLGFSSSLNLEVNLKILAAFGDLQEMDRLIQVEDAVTILTENLTQLKPKEEWMVSAFCDNTIQCVKNIMVEYAMIESHDKVKQ